MIDDGRYERRPGYERVTFRSSKDGRARSVILTDIHVRHSEFGDLVFGLEVDREGSTKDRRHLISADLIDARTPMKMDLHYGELRVARD